MYTLIDPYLKDTSELAARWSDWQRLFLFCVVLLYQGPCIPARPSRNSRDNWRLNSELKLRYRAMGYPPICARARSNPARVSCPTLGVHSM
jgi:hypothetical protein